MATQRIEGSGYGRTTEVDDVTTEATQSSRDNKANRKNDSSSVTTAPAPDTSPSASSSPTQGGAEVTNAQAASGYANDPLAELQKDPEYQRLVSELEWYESLYGGFNVIEWNHGGWWGTNDGEVWMQDINAAANDPNSPGHEAAKKLLSRPDLLAKIDQNGDGKFTKTEYEQLKNELSAKKRAMEDAARAKHTPPPLKLPIEPRPLPKLEEVPAKSPDEIFAEIERNTVPRPEPSKARGLEGAAENVSKMIEWTEDEIDRLQAEMMKTSDDKVAKAIERKIQKLMMRMQSLTALMNQLMTMMSNLSKMYSDIAMNAIRNMR